MPRGAPIVHLQLNLPDGSEPVVYGFLTSPEGQTLAGSVIPQPSGPQLIGVTKVNPQPGRWTFTATGPSPVGGTAVSVPFTGSVSLQPFPIKVSGVPDSRRSTIPAGGSTSGSVKVTNTGNTDLQLFLDPRLVRRQLYSLTPISQATGVTLPLSLDVAPPEFLVPTQTNLLLASAQGSAPLTVDWGFGDPDLLMASHGNNATGAFAQSEVTNGIWSITPSLTGPIAPAGETGTVDTGHGRTDPGVRHARSARPRVIRCCSTSTRPPIRASRSTLAAGQSTTIPVTFTASGRRGSVVSGDLFVDDYQFNTRPVQRAGRHPLPLPGRSLGRPSTAGSTRSARATCPSATGSGAIGWAISADRSALHRA